MFYEIVWVSEVGKWPCCWRRNLAICGETGKALPHRRQAIARPPRALTSSKWQTCRLPLKALNSFLCKNNIHLGSIITFKNKKHCTWEHQYHHTSSNQHSIHRIFSPTPAIRDRCHHEKCCLSLYLSGSQRSGSTPGEAFGKFYCHNDWGHRWAVVEEVREH